MEKAKTAVEFQRDQLKRSQIFAPNQGTIIFQDEDDWLGKPVKIGEKIAELAKPRQTQLKILLPVADRIQLQAEDKVKFYLNSNPFAVMHATIHYIAYNASLQENGDYAYLIKAQFNTQQQLPLVGLRGIAKVYGKRVSLFTYLFRRPMLALRQFFGW